MVVYCGIDWAEHHHDVAVAVAVAVAVVDVDGAVLAKRRITDDVAGFIELSEILCAYADDPDDLTGVDVALETDRGLLVAALRGAGYRVFAINPKAVDRYRDRYAVSGANPTPKMHWCWPTCCVPTGPDIARCRTTPSRLRRSRCWPAPIKTRSAPGSVTRTGCGRCCASSSPPP